MGRPPCCSKNSDLKKGPWTPEEDEVLISYIQKNGHDSWCALPKRAGLNRCGKSCRLRWINYLRPDINRGQFSEDEENLIINLHSALGNKWSRIASQLPGRTDNEIKNFWNTHIRKKFLKAGIDPKTHKPVPNLGFLINTITQLTASPLNLPYKVLNVLSPWTNINDQLLHNILQIVNMTPLPNIMNPTFLDLQYNFKKPDELQINEMINEYVMNHSEDWMKYVNMVAIEESLSECNSIGASLMGSCGDGINPASETFSDHKTLSDGFCIENQLPGLLPMSPGEPANDQVNIKNLQESNAFEAGLDDYYDSLLNI